MNTKENILGKILLPLAKFFIAGENLEDALKKAKELNQEGKSVAINYLGEHIFSKKRAQEIVNEYLKIPDLIKKRGLKADISLKLTQLGLDIEEQFCLQNLRNIVEAANRLEIDVEIDMEGSKYTEKTIRIFLELLKNYRNLRIALQARLFRTPPDLTKIAGAGGRVRLCKGAYKEWARISEQDPYWIFLRFLTLTHRVFQETSFPAVATHDESLIRGCKESFHLAKSEFEFQMLYNVSPQLQQQLVKEGYNLRVYLPYGKDWISYFTRRLSNPAFVLDLIKMKLKR